MIRLLIVRPLIVRLLSCGLMCVLLGTVLPVQADEPEPRGALLIIGGGLRPDNEAVLTRFVAMAGGREKARFVLFPCASKTDRPAREFAEILVSQGVPHERISIVDLMPENADRQAANPQIIEQIRQANAAFFVGGDQARIIQSLRKADGTPAPALLALEKMWHAGGVIAGSSAGAAMQSIRMLRVAGLPDKSLDPGMDALDFGVCSDVRRRGLLVSEGLGFFTGGIVDQHFSQFRGRLGRLSQALIHERIRFGFGIDENTAMAVAPDGLIEVVGPGSVTIIDAADASSIDDPLGCQLRGLKLNYLQTGDRFDPSAGTALIRPEKKILVDGTQDYDGNHLITDIDGAAALPWAICFGLAENTSHKQEAVTLRYHNGFAHGYRYTFTETAQSKMYGGYADHYYSYAAVNLEFVVDPILGNLQAPQTQLPIDLPNSAARRPLAGLWFRGILLADEGRHLRPAAAITRRELAGALQQTIHLTSPWDSPPTIQDVRITSSDYDGVVKLVVAGLMTLDKAGRFRPDDSVTREEAAVSLVGLANLLGDGLPQAPATTLKDESEITAANRPAIAAAIRIGLVRTSDGHFRPAATFSREEAALAICQLIGFGWAARSEARGK